MIKHIIVLVLVSLPIIYLLSNCANPSTPTGGPRDTLPPLLIESVPKNKSINFNGNRIEMIFDEYIKFEQAEEKLIITPSINSKFKTRWNKNRVTITFDEDKPFKENTTYTFNFQDAIKDINENNVWEDPRFVFSTGNYLDSLMIFGRVKELMTKEPAKEGIISLYYSDDTLNILEDKPPYFTNIDKEGYFSLENLPSDTFNVYAVNDQNNNLTLDAQSEAYDFLTEPIQTSLIEDSVFFFYQKLNINPIKIFSSQSIRGNFDVSFNKYITSYSIGNDRDITFYSNLVDDNTKLRIYNTPQGYSFDSLLININTHDSIGNVLDTAIYVKFTDYDGPISQFTSTFKPDNNKEIKPEFNGIYQFNKPIFSVNYDSLFFRFDSLNIVYLDSNNLEFNDHKDRIQINVNLSRDQLSKNDSTGEETNKFIFTSGRGSFISIEKDSSQSITKSYSFYDPANFGIIKGQIISQTNSFTIELLDERYNVIDTIKNKSNYIIDKIEPGNYFLRVLFDTNQNGQWDPGNLLEKEKPEPVIFYYDAETNTRILSIKANWELTDINVVYPVD